MRRIIFLALIPLLALSATGCRTGTGLIGTRQEIEIGQNAAKQIEARYRVSTDPRYVDPVRSIGARLAARSDRRDVPYTFKVLDSDEINAVALPGGPIYVFRGLMDFAGSDTHMLAGVLAHEVGHISARHHAQMMQAQLLTGVAVQVLTGGDIQRLATIFANLQFLRYSREHEFESDEIGVRLSANAGYNPHGLSRFLRLLAEKQGTEPRGLARYFATHPATTERIKRAEALAANQKGR
jgi:beta-barrel assembly-enhancing protease